MSIYYILSGLFFWNQSFISKNTHFEMSILTQIGFSSNLMASGTVQQLNKSSWPLQIPIVCRLGKGSPMPETHIAPNHTPTIADFVPKWLNTPTLLYYWDLASLQLMQLLRPLDTTVGVNINLTFRSSSVPVETLHCFYSTKRERFTFRNYASINCNRVHAQNHCVARGVSSVLSVCSVCAWPGFTCNGSQDLFLRIGNQ